MWLKGGSDPKKFSSHLHMPVSSCPNKYNFKTFRSASPGVSPMSHLSPLLSSFRIIGFYVAVSFMAAEKCLWTILSRSFQSPPLGYANFICFLALCSACGMLLEENVGGNTLGFIGFVFWKALFGQDGTDNQGWGSPGILFRASKFQCFSCSSSLRFCDAVTVMLRCSWNSTHWSYSNMQSMGYSTSWL